MISSVLAVGNDSPNAARHPMRFFSSRMRSVTIFSNSSSVTVDLLHTSSGLGSEIEDMAEAAAREKSGCVVVPMVSEGLNPAVARRVGGAEVLRRQIWGGAVGITA